MCFQVGRFKAFGRLSGLSFMPPAWSPQAHSWALQAWPFRVDAVFWQQERSASTCFMKWVSVWSLNEVPEVEKSEESERHLEDSKRAGLIKLYRAMSSCDVVCGDAMCQRCQHVSTVNSVTSSGNGALSSTVSQRAQGAPTQSTRSASGCLVE